ncbi:hypothetical protein Dimus_017501 [Dionaea muscipula]
MQYGFDELPKSYSFNGPSSRGEEFGAAADPEMKRKKRVAFYNMYTMEGKVKLSLRKSYKWIKGKLRRLWAFSFRCLDNEITKNAAIQFTRIIQMIPRD